MACWSLMIQSPLGALETFKRIQNTKKRDSQVMERLWQLQALFMTVRIYRPYMDTGHELCVKA